MNKHINKILVPFITTIPPRGPQYLFSIGLNPEPVSPKENRHFDSNRITVQTPTADTATTITTTITYSASVSMAATKNTIQFSPNYSFFSSFFRNTDPEQWRNKQIGA